MKLGRLDAAEKMFKAALEGREKAMGRDDRYTVEIVNHLGALYTWTGDYNKAEVLLLRALKYLDHTFEPYYMATQPTANNLGILYMQQNRLEDAEKMMLRTTGYLEAGFGPAHASTLSAFHNQALLYRKQGKTQDARKLLEKTIEGWEESGEGVAKPEADSKYCLADIYEFSEDRSRDSERVSRDAAKLYEYALGKGHSQTKEAYMRADKAVNSAGVGSMKIS